MANGNPILIVGAKFARGLAITRIITGSLIMLFAILTIPLLGWKNYVGFMILSGLVVGCAGLYSLCSSAKIESPGVHRANRYLAFAALLYMLIDFVIYAVAVQGMNYTPTSLAIYICLFVLSVAEFAMALTVTIFWYKSCCSGCCYGQGGEVNRQSNTTSSSALVQSSVHTAYQSCYPAASSQHTFRSLAPPPYSSLQEDTNTNDDNAALV